VSRELVILTTLPPTGGAGVPLVDLEEEFFEHVPVVKRRVYLNAAIGRLRKLGWDVRRHDNIAWLSRIHWRLLKLYLEGLWGAREMMRPRPTGLEEVALTPGAVCQAYNEAAGADVVAVAPRKRRREGAA